MENTESAKFVAKAESLSEFTSNILQQVNISCSDDFSTLDPTVYLSNDKTQGQCYGDDQFEGIFYRTVTEETEVALNFVSNFFFNAFRNKLTADFSESIKLNDMQTVLKFTMHIKCLRCDVKMDSTTNIVTVSGVGRLIWRSEYFPRVAHNLFRQYVQEVDSLVQESQTEEVKVAQRPLETTGIFSSEIPQWTSTPIVSRIEQPVNILGCEKYYFTGMFQKIQSLEDVIRDLKQSIIVSVERKVEELKSTLVKSVDMLASKQTYADIARQPLRSDSRSSQATDEGYCNNSASIMHTKSLQTHAKTAYLPEIQAPVATVESTTRKLMISSPPQQVPVRITKRNDTGGNPSDLPNRAAFTHRIR